MKKIGGTIVLGGLTLAFVCMSVDSVLYDIMPEVKLAPEEAIVWRDYVARSPWRSVFRIGLQVVVIAIFVWQFVYAMRKLWGGESTVTHPLQ